MLYGAVRHVAVLLLIRIGTAAEPLAVVYTWYAQKVVSMHAAGSTVGRRDGKSDPTDVGEGAVDGTSEGASEGRSEGTSDGTDEGTSDGASEKPARRHQEQVKEGSERV
jgi:hypothetical protein